MSFYVYMIQSITPGVNKTYVGYTKKVKDRLKKHNTNKGAKSTKGYKWKLIYIKKFYDKKEALAYEYYLKKNKKKRKNILNISKNEDICLTSL